MARASLFVCPQMKLCRAHARIAHCCPQTFEDISAILLSQPTIKDIRIRIKAAFFGKEWAATQEQDTFVGVLVNWKSKKDRIVMVKWEGWNRARQCVLASLEEDGDGDPLELELLPFDDGRPPPTLVEAGGDPEAGVLENSDDFAAADGDNDEEAENMVEMTTANVVKPLNITYISSLKWKKEAPEGVHRDARVEPRDKPSLPTELQLKDIVSLFFYLLPDGWIDLQLKHTNPKLQGHDKINSKLTKGEVIQFWGYVLALSLHTGESIDRMWSDTPQPGTILPPPNLGRHGMCYNRFKKLRSVLSFGPSDEQTLRKDPWAFVRDLVTLFNKHRHEYITPGWLMTVAFRHSSANSNILLLSN
ncbi:hypothetical protein AB1Y20_007172 [Prymnesium parvum]|uniref:PiggyBac transposable element-derived protein domain-containing protein n=1 Tax=Prymnesium parvum TaxID=97485 RepID=A0AB34IWL8_PRYPA